MTDKRAIHSNDIPELLRLHFPQFESSIKLFTEGERYPLNYAILGEITGQIRTTLERDKYSADALHVMKALLDFAEEVLERGDPSSQDLVVIEIIELVDEPPFTNLQLEECLGLRSRIELAKFRDS
jgi:hypothetical protein